MVKHSKRRRHRLHQSGLGEKPRVRFIGSNRGFIHPMHIHGGGGLMRIIDVQP